MRLRNAKGALRHAQRPSGEEVSQGTERDYFLPPLPSLPPLSLSPPAPMDS